MRTFSWFRCNLRFIEGFRDYPDLPSSYHPADQRSCGEAYCKRSRNSQHKVPLEALSCVIQEFFGSIAALFCGTPHYSYAVLYCVGNRTGCTRSLVS
jgi:hypothetical protein